MNRIGPAGFLFYIALGVALSVGLSSLLGGHGLYGGLGAVVMIATVPRLHDIGRSGWWALIVLLFGSAAVALFEAGEPLFGALASLPVAAMVAALAIIPGKGANRYGQPPVRWYG